MMRSIYPLSHPHQPTQPMDAILMHLQEAQYFPQIPHHQISQTYILRPHLILLLGITLMHQTNQAQLLHPQVLLHTHHIMMQLEDRHK